MLRRSAIALFLLAPGCAQPSGFSMSQSPSAPLAVAPPHRRAPPSVPYSSDTSLLADRVKEAIALHDRDRWEAFVDAMDPGERASDVRLEQKDVDDGKWKREWLFQNGNDLFDHDFGPTEGYGPGRARVQRPKLGGPDALACVECHQRGGFDGSGDLSQNAFFDGDGRAADSATERNPPALLGLGPEQKLAEEMSTALSLIRTDVVRNARVTHTRQSARLAAKGIDFGTIAANPDGSLDASSVAGVDPDLVVKPFGWKGDVATVRAFATNGFQLHFGIQLPGAEVPGGGPAWDKDADGSPNEITGGMMTSIVFYLSRLELPVMIPPEDPPLLERHGRGSELFESAGCAACHVPSLPLADPKLTIAPGLVVDLLAEGEAPRPRADVYGPGTGGIPIFLFSDLKRHHMGDALGRRRGGEPAYGASGDLPADEFLTRPLWGVADTAPYLHDGRATTLDDAIRLHGGEAAPAAAAFEALSPDERADLRIFLLSLTRYPRIDFR